MSDGHEATPTTANLPCPYLGTTVLLDRPTIAHIEEQHSDLLPEHIDRLVETLADPDEVRQHPDDRSLKFVRRYGRLHVVVAVRPSARGPRVATAHLARRLSKGDTVLWTR